MGKPRSVPQSNRVLGHVLGDRYELGPVLGQGGMARVHQGLDRQLGRQVAIKVLAPPFDRDGEFVERFRREARAAAGLSHPNIVAVFDSGSDDGTHFIVTELVEGETLADRLRRDGPMPPADAVAVAVDIARALAAAHARGLIHRDIKPGNVMLLPDGRVKVVDFGIARAAGSDTLTNTGVVLGSTAYLSPEQAGGQPVGERADLYSLGCLLYEMLTGHVPFSADTPIATMYRHVNEDAPPPSTIAPVQHELEDVVLRCLEKDPKRRFASAAELEAALLAVPLARGGDTMRLENVGAAETQPVGRVDAAETQPVGRVDAAAAGGAITAGAAGAVAAGGDEATTKPAAATAGGGGGLGSRRIAPSHAGPRRKPRGRRPWLIAALVVALLAVIGVLIAATSDPWRPKAEARAAAQETARDALPPDTPVTFASAWSGLVSAIASAQAGDDISDKAAEELTKKANELLDAYREGDPDKLEESLQHLDEHLAKTVEDEEISPAAADAVDTAIVDLAAALQNEDALGEVVPSEAPTGPTDESGGREEKHGSPPYGEANGHDED
ncbi:MAG TPA: protein kinase [Actinomycetota bacterium]|nr:protein kinase [Actinomycetota bacterium]